MSDIFISYAAEDRFRAQELAQGFEALGWTVWWDRKIPVGGKFDAVIGAALKSAKCVVVLWSTRSAVSDWVLEEAHEALGDGRLVPVLIEDVEIPFGFRRSQAAQLQHWRGDRDDQAFADTVRSIAARVGSAAVPVPVPPPAAGPASAPASSPSPTPAPATEPRPRPGLPRWFRVLTIIVLIPSTLFSCAIQAAIVSKGLGVQSSASMLLGGFALVVFIALAWALRRSTIALAALVLAGPASFFVAVVASNYFKSPSWATTLLMEIVFAIGIAIAVALARRADQSSAARG